MKNFTFCTAVIGLTMLLAGIAQTQAPAPKADPVVIKSEPVVADVEPLDVVILGPTETPAGEQVILTAQGNARKYLWSHQAELGALVCCDNRTLAFATRHPGIYTFVLAGSDATGDVAVYRHTVQVAGSPTPQPTPDPPNPDPTPTPAPVVTGPIVVLLLEESEDRTGATALLMDSWPIREYLNAHCEKGSDGRPMWFWADDDVVFTRYPQVWQDAMKLPRATLPWMVVLGKGGTGPPLFSGPLTKTVEGKSVVMTPDEVLTILEKFGGK